MEEMKKCFICPRHCGANRESGEKGVCGEGAKMRVARISLHMYEEPPISGSRGSGTVFFCGCSLGCVFCQNKEISRGATKDYREYTPEELSEELLRLESDGAHNINLVTAAHFAPLVARTLRIARPRLHIPVVYNSSGYETVESLRLLDGLVDVYMPDLKYATSDIAKKYSNAADYPTVAKKALAEMHRQVGKCQYDQGGMLVRGMIVRHLVLPSCRADSMRALEELAALLPVEDILLSLMSQYTPDFCMDSIYKELTRRLTRFEYDSVSKKAVELGFDGFFQNLSSASASYTPDF